MIIKESQKPAARLFHYSSVQDYHNNEIHPSLAVQNTFRKTIFFFNNERKSRFRLFVKVFSLALILPSFSMGTALICDQSGRVLAHYLQHFIRR